MAEGKLIVLGEGGLLGLFKVSPAAPLEICRAQIPQLHHPCWAGPVLSQDRVHLAAPQIEVDVLQRCDAAIVLSNASHLQERRLHLWWDGHGIDPS